MIDKTKVILAAIGAIALSGVFASLHELHKHRASVTAHCLQTSPDRCGCHAIENPDLAKTCYDATRRQAP
jgi:hypothetical protein